MFSKDYIDHILLFKGLASYENLRCVSIIFMLNKTKDGK